MSVPTMKVPSSNERAGPGGGAGVVGCGVVGCGAVGCGAVGSGAVDRGVVGRGVVGCIVAGVALRVSVDPFVAVASTVGVALRTFDVEDDDLLPPPTALAMMATTIKYRNGVTIAKPIWIPREPGISLRQSGSRTAHSPIRLDLPGRDPGSSVVMTYSPGKVA
jgi:hypothetical protein